MSLDLDLSSGRAKLSRAIEHVVVLEREVPQQATAAESGPYAIRFTDVDPSTGWCDVLLAPNITDQPGFGVVVGDAVHNLRSALDYIITALVEAQGVTLTTQHQFPIFKEESTYHRKVLVASGGASKSGPLRGLSDGVSLIEQLQPFKRSAPTEDPLWHIHRFSNADKHREPAAFLAIPSGKLDTRFKGIPIETEPVLEIPDWTPHEEHIIHRIRFDPPRAYDFRVDSPLMISIGFTTPAFNGDPPSAITVPLLRAACDHVGVVLDSFELL